MQANRRRLGRAAETAARAYLEQKGFRFIASNVFTRWGEIDLIFEDGETLVFVEVKNRRSAVYGSPEDAVHHGKRTHIVRTALIWMQDRGIHGRAIRFDVISLDPTGIRHLADAFDGGDDYYY